MCIYDNILSYFRSVELRHYYVYTTWVLTLCNMCVFYNSQQFSFFFVQTLHNDLLYSYIEDVNLLFCAYLIFYYTCIRHYYVYTTFWVFTLCNLLFIKFSFLFIQPCILIFGMMEDLQFVFCTVFICNFLTFLEVELRIKYVLNTYEVLYFC